MKNVLFAFAATLMLVNIGLAEISAERKTAAGQLLEAMEMEKQMAQSFEMVKQSIPAMMAQMGVSGADAEAQQALMKKVMDLVESEMNWSKIKDDYIAIYAETFSEEELKGLTAFYQSPIGKKLNEKQPELMQRSMQVTQSKMVTLLPKIQALATQE